MASLVSIVENALAGIASALPDAVRVMRHETESGNAIKSSSVELTGEATTDTGAVEKSRVIVSASSFASLASGVLVTLGDDSHVVTSVKTDPISASMTVGLSKPLTKVAADVVGVRGSRPVRFPIDILAENNGLAEDMADGFAPTLVRSWTLCFPVDAWPENGEPQIGDEFRFEDDGQDVRVKLARCNRREHHYIVNARSR